PIPTAAPPPRGGSRPPAAGRWCAWSEKQRALSSGGAGRPVAARLHRLAAGGVTFIRCAIGVPGADDHTLDRHIELFGRDLRHGGEYALAEFDAAGRKLDLARRGEVQPAIEARVVGEHARQRHARPPSRQPTAAFSTS